MRTVDRNWLQPDELAFCLETNGSVGAHRFISFLQCLTGLEGGNLIPHYGVEIVELSTGSIFGRLRLLWNTDDLDTERVERMEGSVAELRRRLDEQSERQTSAAERSAVAAERQVEQSVRGNRTQQRALAVATAAVVLSFWQLSTSGEDNSCADAVGAIMDADGVSSISLWCREDHLVLHRHDVGLKPTEEDDVLQAEGGTFEISGRASAVVASASHSEENQRIGVGEDGNLPNEINFPKAAYFSTGADAPPIARPSGIAPHSSSHGHIASQPQLPQARGRPYHARGKVGFDGSLMIFTGEGPDGNSSPRSAILIPPEQYMLGEGQRFEVKGRFVELPGDYDLVIADSVVFVT